MSKEYFFSIVVPVYNIENYVDKCVKSIICQKYDKYELIIVDDGSTDNSYTVAKKYEKNNIKVVKKKNGGLSSARNYGLRYTHGDYVWFIDGDDYIENDSIKKLNEEINRQKEKKDIIAFQYYEVKNGKKSRFVDRISWEDEEYKPLVCASAWSRIYAVDYLKKNNIQFAEGLIYEDLEIIPYLMATARVSFYKEPLYNYVYRNGSIMNEKTFKNNRDDKFIVLERLFQKFEEGGINKKYKNQLTYLAIRHLIMVYSTEIMKYKKDIYMPRCNRVLNFLDKMDAEWARNRYLKESSLSSRIFAWLYLNRKFNICKLMIKIGRK